jgi:glycosyltransferase involved in cell wall biosynthesis
LRIAMLSPVAWRTPPRHYGPWEQIVSSITEGLVERGLDVTLFATADSVTRARLHAVCPRPWEEDRDIHPKVWECLHISEVFEHAAEFDIIHNHFDFLPLSYCGLVKTPVLTTIHGFSSPKIVPVYKKYDPRVHYVSISNADRNAELHYIGTVYHGIELDKFTLNEQGGERLVFFGRIHADKGAREAIEIARACGRGLDLCGIIQDESYFKQYVEPFIDGHDIVYHGSVGPKDRDRLLGGSLALLHPIGFHEPFGLSVVEAMAVGTPVIAFRKGSMPEIIEDGVNGYLVDDVAGAAAAVERLPAISRRRCREVVEQRFSVGRMVDDYIRVYEAIMAGTSPLEVDALPGHVFVK